MTLPTSAWISIHERALAGDDFVQFTGVLHALIRPRPTTRNGAAEIQRESPSLSRNQPAADVARATFGRGPCAGSRFKHSQAGLEGEAPGIPRGAAERPTVYAARGVGGGGGTQARPGVVTNLATNAARGVGEFSEGAAQLPSERE